MIVDLLIVLILIGFVISGYRRGFVMCLFGLVTTVIACFAATAAQHLWLEKMTAFLSPLLLDYVFAALPQAGATTPEVVGLIASLLAGVVLFLLVFTLVYSLLHSVALAVNLAAKLPVLSGLNHLAGGALGLVWGVLAVFLGLSLLGSLELLPADALSGPVSGFLWNFIGKLFAT